MWYGQVGLGLLMLNDYVQKFLSTLLESLFVSLHAGTHSFAERQPSVHNLKTLRKTRYNRKSTQILKIQKIYSYSAWCLHRYQAFMERLLNWGLSNRFLSVSSSSFISSYISFSSVWLPGGSLLFHLAIILGGLDRATEYVSHLYGWQQRETC